MVGLKVRMSVCVLGVVDEGVVSRRIDGGYVCMDRGYEEGGISPYEPALLVQS